MQVNIIHLIGGTAVWVKSATAISHHTFGPVLWDQNGKLAGTIGWK